MLLLASLALAVLWTIWTAICLALNYRRAQKLGVPLVLIPISTMNILWIILQPPIIALIERLHGPSNFTRFSSRDWHFKEKARPHVEIGDAWAIVTPGQIWFNVANPDAIVDIFQRRTQFIRPVELYQMLNVFGHNAATVGWAEWKRQRKLIAAPFNERTNHLVWTESIGQADDMIQEWFGQGTKGNLGLQTDTRTLALNVLAATGFGRSYKFHGHNSSHSEDENKEYRGALSTLMDNALFLMLVPHNILNSKLAPRSWARIGHAAHSFRKYMLDMLDHENRLLAQKQPGTSQLVSSLLRASEDISDSKLDSGNLNPPSLPGKCLTINELLGNIFLINFAGHDTTANTLAYALINLATQPQVQEWIAEEVQTVVGDSSSPEWSYEAVFPKLKRPLAVMYETVRLFPPIMALPKYTNNESQNLVINGASITVPPKTYVVPSLLAMHTHPKHWGSDASVWKPSRWIDENDNFLSPHPGTYFPWSEGAQNCPGKKFAQVEFVAVIGAVFHVARVQPFCIQGQNLDDASKRLVEILNQNSHGVLLRMKDADSARLLWTPA